MSVVNRMLLDIDRRHGAADVQNRGPYPDIRSVPPAASAPRRSGSGLVAAIVAASTGIAAILVMNYSRVPMPVVSPRVASPAPAPAPAPAAPVAAISLPQPAVAAPVVAEMPSEPVAKAPRTRAAPTVIESFKLSRQLSPVEERPGPVPAVPSSTPAKVAMIPAAPAKALPLRQVAADETVAAARLLWNEGSRAGALATLRDALAVAEGARNGAAVGPLARELARLEIADNRPQAALDLLRRLEVSLADDAEAWALRANAEQRLALHAESARSYLAALRGRPAEGRWMLGAAISFAADGKLDEANGWADRARERGAVTAPMEAYLQQLGVAARR